MITPPDDIKQTIDKTIGYVVKNGISFEKRLLANNSDNKFDFLQPSHEHYGYYKHHLGQLMGETDVVKEDTQKVEKPRELKFLTKLPAISTVDLEIVKLVALFTVVNGPDYLKRLLDHEKKLGNVAQFEFTRKSHSLHPLFSTYISQYKLVVDYFHEKDSEEIRKLHDKLVTDDVLGAASRRAQYERDHRLNLRNKRKLQKQIQVHYASIDWQDFVVVGKVEFDAIDEVQELPVPLNMDDLVYRSLESKQKDVIHEKEHKEEQKEEQKDSIISKAPRGMKIRAAGESRLKKTKAVENTIKCPITGELIPEDKFDTHLKTLLRDPRYQQQQDNFMRKNFSYASNLTTDQVYENIKRLVRKRGAEESEADPKRIKHE